MTSAPFTSQVRVISSAQLSGQPGLERLISESSATRKTPSVCAAGPLNRDWTLAFVDTAPAGLRRQSLPADSTYAGHGSRRRSRVRIPSLPPFPSRRFNDVGEVETRQQAMHRGAARVLDTRANLESQVDLERDRARWYAPLFKRILMMNEPITSRALGWRTSSAWAGAVVLW